VTVIFLASYVPFYESAPHPPTCGIYLSPKWPIICRVGISVGYQCSLGAPP